MTNQKQNGYVFITVAVIITILISSLTIAISNQNKNIDLIQFYENSNVMEEEISAIELVITEYLNSNLKNYNDLIVNSSFQTSYETPTNAKISVKIKPNDNCFNINSLFYKNSSNNLEVNRVEFERLNSITKKLKINNDVIYSIQDWIDTDNVNNQNLEESLSFKSNGFTWLPRNYLAVSNTELYMIPGIIKFNEIVGDLLCVNLYNFKFNVLNLNSKKLYLLLPFLSEKNAEDLLEILKKDIWPNSKDNSKTIKNISNFQKEVEYLLRRPLLLKEKKLLDNVSFVSRSMYAEILYENNLGEQYTSSSKYEVDSENIVKLIYRNGPFKEIPM